MINYILIYILIGLVLFYISVKCDLCDVDYWEEVIGWFIKFSFLWPFVILCSFISILSSILEDVNPNKKLW